MHEPLSATLDAFIAKGVVGACAAVMTRGAPPIVVARGLADRERRIPFATESLTKIGSCTKTFVAATLLRLIADGLVSPDVAVSTWFPNLPKSDRISVRQLVNHRSGLPEFEFDMPVAPGRTWTPQQIVDLAFAVRPQSEPGLAFAYSNTGYVLAGMLIEALTNDTLAGQIRKRVLVPLGLADTWAAAGEAFPVERLVRGYYWRPAPDPIASDLPVEKGGEMWKTGGTLGFSDDLQDSTELFPFSGAYAAGDIVSTAPDLARFLDGLFAGRIFPLRYLDEMTGDRITAAFPGTRIVQSGTGLFAMRYGGRQVFGHQGSMPGYVTVMAHEPRSGLTAVLATNSGSGNRFSFYAAGLHAVLDDILAIAFG
jgi:D-alanyl-D-alanine carboxypeptidase